MTHIALEDRPSQPLLRATLEAQGLPGVLADCLARRGVASIDELDTALIRLHPPHALTNAPEAAASLGRAIQGGASILIVGDYDADGATATAVMVRGLRRFGATVDFLVPDRFAFGYGLTPALVEHARKTFSPLPDWLITVDNGVSSHAGVAAAQALGMEVLVTDHHLPGRTLPQTRILNPQLPNCTFPSKHLAGVGVAFYLIMALRGWLAQQQHFKGDAPRIDDLLPLVALGTVADLVTLDANNRRLVAQGLQRIRKGIMPPGLAALFETAARPIGQASASDLGFSIGPRLNAAGRLSDMSIGIRCLITDNDQEAFSLAQSLDALNRSRREVEGQNRDEALAQLAALPDVQDRKGLVLFDAGWHQGVVGLIASRLKDKAHRPTIVFAPDQNGDGLKGSGRSIPGVHLRDVLERVDSQHPGLIRAFGGHAMAAGLSIDRASLADFEAAFEAAVEAFSTPEHFSRSLLTDGELAPEHHTVVVAETLTTVVWGQGFAPPLFRGRFVIREQRLLKQAHLKMSISPVGSPAHRFDAIWFNCPDHLPPEAELAYGLAINEWQGSRRIQLLVSGTCQARARHVPDTMAVN